MPKKGTPKAGSSARKAQPTSSRPHMPGYGIKGPQEGTGLLPWKWAEERLQKAHNFWVASTRPDRRPHVMPVWAVWMEGALYFSTGAKSRKARNLRANPSCVVCSEHARGQISAGLWLDAAGKCVVVSVQTIELRPDVGGHEGPG